MLACSGRNLSSWARKTLGSVGEVQSAKKPMGGLSKNTRRVSGECITFTHRKILSGGFPNRFMSFILCINKIHHTLLSLSISLSIWAQRVKFFPSVFGYPLVRSFYLYINDGWVSAWKEQAWSIREGFWRRGNLRWERKCEQEVPIYTSGGKNISGKRTHMYSVPKMRESMPYSWAT